MEDPSIVTPAVFPHKYPSDIPQFTVYHVSVSVLSQFGLENNTYLNNTVVRDKSNPNSVGEISYQDLNNKRIVEWEIPDSNGTEYEFKAQTYKINFDSKNGTDLIMDTEFN